MTSDFTSPERSAQIRQAKRYRAAIQKRGICSACTCREKTFGIWHCRDNPGRAHGMCQQDGRLPQFQFDDEVLKEFRDAA